MVVNPGEERTVGGVEIRNEQNSNGKIRVRKQADGSVEIKCDGSVTSTIDGVDAGDNVIVATNSRSTITGTGGSVNVGSGSSVTVTNNAPPGGGNMTVNLPGGSTITVLPGMTVPVTG